MQTAGEKPNEFTFGSVLCACAQIRALEEGKQVHAYVLKALVNSNMVVLNALVDMYVKCQSIEDARQVFDKMAERNVVSWTAMIAGYAREGISREGLALFQQMETAGVKPNSFTFTSILSICSSLEALEHGKQVHACVVKSGLQSATSVGNALVDMYGKCGGLGYACRVFTRLPELSVVSWNSLIAGYVKQGHCKEAFHIFKEMREANASPDQFTFATILSVCADLALLDKGKQFHACIVKGRFGLNIVLGTALIDMYAKCGSIVDAGQVFDRMPQLDLISWNAMITGYAKHGDGRRSLGLFKQMGCTGMKPNHSTFIGILLGCSHSGLVDEGWHHFKSMSQDHGIMPRAEHYACIVDLLGRAGCLNEAHELINNMPVEPDAAVWGALLGACSIHVNLKLGEYAAKHIFELEPENAGMYVVLSNMYAAAGMWGDVASVRKLMKDRGIDKEPGCSWIEIKNKVYSFLAGDRSHPQTEEIYLMLDKLTEQMKRLGYVPNKKAVLYNTEE